MHSEERSKRKAWESAGPRELTEPKKKMGKQGVALTTSDVLNTVEVYEGEVAERQAVRERHMSKLEEGHAASSDNHAQCGPECHSGNKSHSASVEEGAEQNQREQAGSEQMRTPEGGTGRQPEQCPPWEGSPKTRLLSTNKGKGLR